MLPPLIVNCYVQGDVKDTSILLAVAPPLFEDVDCNFLCIIAPSQPRYFAAVQCLYLQCFTLIHNSTSYTRICLIVTRYTYALHNTYPCPLLMEVGVHGDATSSRVDHDLQTQIRSMFASRNQSRAPVTPYPSPDYTLSPHDFSEDQFDYFSNSNTQDVGYSTPESSAKLALHSRQLSMVVNRFDGPAGQVEDEAMEGLRKHPSQPEFYPERRSSVDSKGSQQMFGLNQKTFGAQMGREYRSSSNAKTIGSKPPSKRQPLVKQQNSGQVPRYMVRTVPPTTSNATKKNARPDLQHVPGSYRSDITNASTTPTIGSPMFDHDSNHDPANVSIETGKHTHETAIEALTRASGQSTATDSIRSINLPSLHGKVSQSTLKSNLSSTTSRHVSLKSFPDHPNSGATAEPVLAQGDHYERSRPSRAEELPARANPQENGSTRVKTEGSTLERILAELPPLRQATVTDLDNGHASTVPIDRSRRTTTKLSIPWQPSVEAPTLTLDDHNPGERDIQSTEKPASRKVVQKVEEPKGKPVDDERPPDETTAAPTRRSSELNRVTMGHLKAISHPSAELSSQEPNSRYRIEGFVDESSHLQESPSLPSSGESDATRYNAQAAGSGKRVRKLQKRNCGSPGITRLGSQENEFHRGKHWIQDLMQRRSPAVSSPTLTARPYRRKPDANSMAMEHANPAPALLVDNQYPRLSGTSSTDMAATAEQRKKDTEAFAKVILDLESLLEEALLIAHQAADNNVNEDTTGLLRRRQASSHSSMSSNNNDVHSETATTPLDFTDHVRDHMVVMEPERYDEREHFARAREAIPYPGRSNVQSRNLSKLPGLETTSVGSVHRQAEDNFLHIPGGPLARLHKSNDWTLAPRPSDVLQDSPGIRTIPIRTQKPESAKPPTNEQVGHITRQHQPNSSIMTHEDIRGYIHLHQRPPIQERSSSMALRHQPVHVDEEVPRGYSSDSASEGDAYVADFQTSGIRQRPTGSQRGFVEDVPEGPSHHDTVTSLRPGAPNSNGGQTQTPDRERYSLRDRHHFSIREPKDFSLSRSHRRAPIARDWCSSRKRWVATVACISTALMGIVIGIYAGEVPAIQYAIADEHHYTILGNVVLFIGLAITTILAYPLPLLHGRKPYTLAALAILLPLQFPQAVSVSGIRTSSVATYRVGLLLPRAFSGLVMGFANINFLATLLDLFGASLQSGNPHQETVDDNDVRRHGGGMGVWLGIWTWCSIGSLGVGFLVGAAIISGLSVEWGFWITIIIIAAVLIMNVLTPEVRRSPYRRSMAEVRTGTDISRRIARGEIKMHLQSTGPKHWWEELTAGQTLVMRMLKQPGFLVLSVYSGWIYGQVVIVIVVSRF